MESEEAEEEAEEPSICWRVRLENRRCNGEADVKKEELEAGEETGVSWDGNG